MRRSGCQERHVDRRRDHRVRAGRRRRQDRRSDRDHARCLKRKRAERALAESDERYREILDTTPEGVWRVDAEEHTDYVNPRMASMLGYSPQEMIGRKLSEFMDPEQFEIAQEEMATAREDMRLGVVENSFVRKDGTRCWAGVSHTALTDLHGNHTGGLVDHVRHHRVKSPS